MSFGPAIRPTLKTALCHTRPVMGQMTNTEMHLESWQRMKRDELGCRTARRSLQAKRNIFSVEIRLFTFY